MRKFRNSIAIAAMIAAFSCQKPKADAVKPEESVTTEMTNGLTDNPFAINGYLYASHGIFQNGSLGTIFAFAKFHDPGTSLIPQLNHHSNSENFNVPMTSVGTVSVGSVRFSDLELQAQTSRFTYQFTKQVSSSPHPYWSFSGNGSFKPFDLNVPRGFPNLAGWAGVPDTIKRNKDLVLNFGNLIGNYDSLCVRVSPYQGSSPGVTISKSAAYPQTTIAFSPTDLSKLPNSSAYVGVYLYNYSNITIENKRYVFELARKLDKYVMVK